MPLGRLSSISDCLRTVAGLIASDYGNSDYLNLDVYTYPRIDNTVPSQEVQNGPPSMYDEPDSETRLKRQRKRDIRYQGPRPDPVDSLTNHILPVTTTNIGGAKENEQGEDRNDATAPRGSDKEDLDRDTIGFDPGTLTFNPFGD